MQKLRTALFILNIVATMVIGLHSQEASSLLISAIYEEEMNGDLDAAIKMYLRIINNFPDQREIVAESLWRLGIAHEKIGSEKARTYYQKIISDYTEQTVFRNRATLRLNKLFPMGNGEEIAKKDSIQLVDNSQVSIHKVFSLPSLYGNISPDGGYFVYTNWQTGNLEIYNRSNRQKIELKMGADWMKGFWCDGPQWSSDRDHIAFTWLREGIGSDLRMYNVADHTIKSLTKVIPNTMQWILDWSSEGDFLLVSNFDRKEKQLKILTVSIVDGSINMVKKVPRGESCENCHWTLAIQDEYIIYDKMTSDGTTNLYLMSVNGNEDHLLLENPSNLRIAQWMPDNSGFLYYSDISGKVGLWKATVDAKLKVIDTELILNAIADDDFTSIGITNENIYYYLEKSLTGSLFLMDIDPINEQLGIIQRIPTNRMLPRFSSIWSPDGSKLAYFRIPVKDPRRQFIEIKDLRNGEEKSIIGEGHFIADKSISRKSTQWSPNGKNILVTSWEKDHFELQLIDTNNGTIKKLIDGLESKVYGNRDNLFFVRTDSLTSIISELQLSTGGTRDLFQTADSTIMDLTVSKDQKKLAFVMESLLADDGYAELVLLNLENKQFQKVWIFKPEQKYMADSGLNWLHDNQNLLLAIRDIQKAEQQLYLFDTNSNLMRPVGQPIKEDRNFLLDIRIHPFKNQIVFGKRQQLNNVWELKNY